MLAIREPSDGNTDFADLDPEGALEGRNCLGGIIGDSGTLHLRCLGETRKVLEPQSLELRQVWCLRHVYFIKSREKQELYLLTSQINWK